MSERRQLASPKTPSLDLAHAARSVLTSETVLQAATKACWPAPGRGADAGKSCLTPDIPSFPILLGSYSHTDYEP